MWRSFWQSKIAFPLVFIVGLIVRLVLLRLPAQPYDIGTFQAWGNYVWQYGLQYTYSHVWSDYLPLPMLLFGLIRGLSQSLPLSFPIFFRLFWLTIESLLIFLIVLKLKSSPADKLISFSLLFLFPPFWMNTAWWGQIDSIPTLLTVLAVLLLLRSHKWGSGLALALAVALKPIMLIAGPVFLVLGWHQKALPQLLLSGLLVLALTGLPAVSNPLQALPFVINQAAYQTSMYPATTVNGWNLWSVRGTFWASDHTPVLGLTAQQVGYFLFAVCAFFILRSWARTRWDPSHALLVSGQLLLCFYTFTTRMHERHLMFALPFLLLGSYSRPTKILTALLSLLYLGNLYGALYWVNHAQVWPFSAPVMAVCSWLVVIVTILLLVSSREIFNSKYLPELVLITLALSLRLIGLSHPPVMIFDEVYHSFTAKEYLHNNIAAWEWWTTPPPGFAYEWTHPPVAKYGMVLGMLFFGENSFGWRIGSVVMGVVSLVGLYFLSLRLTGSRSVARLALFMGSIEGLHLVQSRIGMNDAYMLGFLVWSYVSALSSHWKKSAILFGLALASKWSALYGLLPLAVIYWFYLRSFQANKLISSFLLSFRLLLISTLIYLITFVPFLAAGHSWGQLIELHRQMWYYHTHLVATHDYQSTPQEWITVMRPVWYWVNYGSSVKSNIYAQGNPVLLWFALYAYVFVLINSLRSFKALPAQAGDKLISLLLPFIFTFPWLFSPRIMFFYHYLPTAFFLMIPAAILLHSFSSRWRIFFLSLFALSFILMSPVYYGYPISSHYWDTLFRLFPTWR